MDWERQAAPPSRPGCIAKKELMLGQCYDQVCLKIAEIRIRLRSADASLKIGLTSQYLAFVQEEGSESVDLDLIVHYGNIPEVETTSEGFRSGGAWEVSKSGEQYVFRFSSPIYDQPLYKLAVISSDFSHGEVFMRPIPGSSIGGAIYPLEHPFDEVLINHWLAKGHGIELHACGICWEGMGWPCCGSSGAGKSTMARLWQEAHAGEVLSDDRIIIRKFEEFMVYGTPWHGDAHLTLNKGCPVRAVFFLEHAAANQVERLRPIEAASLLLARSFPTFWESTRMQRTLDFINDVVQQVPCFKLGFVPNESVVHFLKDLAHHSAWLRD